MLNLLSYCCFPFSPSLNEFSPCFLPSLWPGRLYLWDPLLADWRLGSNNARHVQNSQRRENSAFCCCCYSLTCFRELLCTQVPSSVIVALAGQCIFHGCWFHREMVTPFPSLDGLVPGVLREATIAKSYMYQQFFFFSPIHSFVKLSFY